MKDCLSLPKLGFEKFNSLRKEEDEPIYTYNDKYMRWFVRPPAYEGRVHAFNQYYKSKSCDDILKTISEELNVKGKIYDNIELFMDYENKHFKTFEKEYQNHFDDYRKEIVEEKETFINEKSSNLPMHQLLKQLKLIDLLWDFDSTSPYPSAMWYKASIYLKVETGYAFTSDMNDELVGKFDNKTFTHGSAILKIKYYNPKNLIVQQIPVRE